MHLKIRLLQLYKMYIVSVKYDRTFVGAFDTLEDAIEETAHLHTDLTIINVENNTCYNEYEYEIEILIPRAKIDRERSEMKASLEAYFEIQISDTFTFQVMEYMYKIWFDLKKIIDHHLALYSPFSTIEKLPDIESRLNVCLYQAYDMAELLTEKSDRSIFNQMIKKVRDLIVGCKTDEEQKNTIFY